MPKKIASIVPFLTVLALAGCITATGPSPASPPSPSVSPKESPSASPTTPAETFTPGAPEGQCLTANLLVSVVDEGSSAGHLHSQVVFTNRGPACVLDGFPTVQVMKAGVPMGSGIEDDSSAAEAPVPLASGGTAVAQLTSVNINSDGGPLGDSCVVDHGTGYLITPPHSYTPIPADVADLPACTNGTVWMMAGPVTAP
jgi:hypothetical protein